jgi:hypothetical protein
MRPVPSQPTLMSKDGPRAITWTHPDGVNTALFEFLAD